MTIEFAKLCVHFINTAPSAFEKIESCTDCMPAFGANALSKFHSISIYIYIIGIKPVEKFTRKCLCYPNTCYFLRLINLIIEKSGISFYQFHREQINFCVLVFRNEFRTEKRSPHVDFSYVQQRTNSVMQRLLSKPKTIKAFIF